MKTLKRLNATALLLLATGFPVAWLAYSQQLSEVDSPIDPDEYRSVMARVVSDVYDLQDLIRDERDGYAVITPPAADFTLRQPIYPIIPFSWKHFPKDLPEILGNRYEYEYSVPVYKLRVIEDRETRQLHFLAHGDEKLFSLDKPLDYDPFEWLKWRYPGLYSGRYATREVKAFEALYDPARVELIVTLIPTEYVEPYLYAQSKVREYQIALKEKEGDGEFMMRSMGTDSNIVITAISTMTNGLQLEIGYPIDFTNRLDVYYATDLMERDWSLISPPLETTGSASVVWLDTQHADVSTEGFYSAGDHDSDSDGDGFSDAFEFFVLGTDPHDPHSGGVYLSGDVLYDGPESGTIYAQAVTESSEAWSKTWQTSLSSPGAYTNLVANEQSYWLKSYMDINDNKKHEIWEPWGIYSTQAIYATNDATGLDIALEDQPSIWGALDYSGGATGNIHVLATTLPDWDTTYETIITWAQGEASLTGDATYVSFPVNYSINGLPPGDYFVRAFIDEDGNGQYSHLEEGGQYAVDPTSISNRVTGIDFAIGLDADADGIPDWWEMQYFGGPTNAVASSDAPLNDGVSNLLKYLQGRNPIQEPETDTSGVVSLFIYTRLEL